MRGIWGLQGEGNRVRCGGPKDSEVGGLGAPKDRAGGAEGMGIRECGWRERNSSGGTMGAEVDSGCGQEEVRVEDQN